MGAQETTIVPLDDLTKEIGEVGSLFTPGGFDAYKPLVKEVFDYVKSLNLDMNKESDRKTLNSYSRKFGSLSSKTTKLGVADRSELEEKKKKSKAVEKDFTDYVDELKSELRKPLDEWIKKDEARVKALESRVQQIVDLGMTKMVPMPKLPSAEIKERLDLLHQIELDDSFEEFLSEAEEEHLVAHKNLRALYDSALEQEERDAELAKLKEAEAEQKRKEREEQIHKEAQEKAEREAQEKIEKVEREARERAEKERLQREAKEKAEADAKAKADAEERARKANKEHRKSVNCEALKALTSNGINEEVAKQIITLIARDQVPNVTINY